MSTLMVAMDVLREARHRRWVVALAAGISLCLLALCFTVQTDVVDGALAATRLFGHVLTTGGESAQKALRPLFEATAYLIFYGGLLFGILACSDFAPRLLSPGRIEAMLALPLRRWELLAGTFAGVLCLAMAGALYGAGGLTVVLGVKTGVWTLRPIAAALLAVAAFAPIYGAMLTASVFARSAAISGALGSSLLIAGIISSHRSTLAPLFAPGWGRSAFEGVTLFLPRIASLGEASAKLASSAETPPLLPLLIGFLLFTGGMFAIGAWRFDRRDF